ncbi:aquaporin [Streptomyces sp. NPDC086077]|uniref:aquaporin n=1 Tax=Streptomyces sp. NPDC086077 TaxID=3154862 RepID=UPI003427CA42
MNPAVTVAMWLMDVFPGRSVLGYPAAQIAGSVIEAGCFIALTLVIGFLLAHPSFGRWLPYVVGLSIALIIAGLGTRSGGSAIPARHFGPALFAGSTSQFWIYLLAPVLGALLGASVHHLLMRRFHTHQPLTYKLCGPTQHSERQDESA